MDIIEETRSRIVLEENAVLNAFSSDYPITYNCDDIWNFNKFKKNFRIKIVKYNGTEMEFDLIGIHAALVNTFRRLLLSEVPSMAIDKVFMYYNTSMIQDEVLAHRLGLIPLKADPRLFEYKRQDDIEGTEQDTLEFELKVKCTKNANALKDSALPADLYLNHNVYTSHMKWLPIGEQGSIYKASDVGPIHNDILISKMRLNQEFDLKVRAVKGIGKDHAKFSPVVIASYRLLPEIKLNRQVFGEQALRLQKCFSPGVIGLKETKHGMSAVVENARYDTCSRNINRHPDLKDAAKMFRVRDHFIFSIESIGALPPDILFQEAIKVLKKKCQSFLEELNPK